MIFDGKHSRRNRKSRNIIRHMTFSLGLTGLIVIITEIGLE